MPACSQTKLQGRIFFVWLSRSLDEHEAHNCSRHQIAEAESASTAIVSFLCSLLLLPHSAIIVFLAVKCKAVATCA